MALLLTVLAGVAALTLIVSAVGLITRVTPTDRTSRGPWGIVSWQSTRSRPLDAQERRWQTALIAADRAPDRWNDLVDEIGRLARGAEIQRDPNPPDEFNADWIRNEISRLDAATTSDHVPT